MATNNRINDTEILFDFQIAPMLDISLSDLRRAIRKHHHRMPSDFMIEFSKDEWDEMRQTNEFAEYDSKVPPFVFTASGIGMICSILPDNMKSTEIVIQIMRTYVKLRKYQPAFVGADKALKKCEKNSNLDFYDIYNQMVKMSVYE